MALSDVLARFATGTYSVSRPAGGSYNADGIWVAGSPSTFNAVAVVQPISGSIRDVGLEALAEGRHIRDMREMRSQTELRERDTVTVDGDDWEVVRATSWTLKSDTHYFAILARQEIPGD